MGTIIGIGGGFDGEYGWHFIADFGKDACCHWWNNLKFKAFCAVRVVVKGEGDFFGLAETDHLESEFAVFCSVGHHVAQAACYPSLSVFVGVFRDDGAELGIIVNLEFDGNVRNNLTFGIFYRDGGFCGLCVIVDHIDFGMVFSAFNHFFWSVVAAKDAGVE